MKIRQRVQTVYLRERKKKKGLIEGAKAPALRSPLLMCNGCICSIDEELSQTDHRDRSPSIVVLQSINKPSGAGDLPPE